MTEPHTRPPSVEQRILAQLVARGGLDDAGASASVKSIACAIGHSNPEQTRTTLKRLAASGRIVLVSPAGMMTPARYRVAVDLPPTGAFGA